MRVAKTIELDEDAERELRVLAKRRRIEVRLHQRALVVLLAAQGLQNKDIAVQVGLDRRQVALWRQRFLDGGIDALREDAPRSGRPATITTEVESRIVHATLHDWSARDIQPWEYQVARPVPVEELRYGYFPSANVRERPQTSGKIWRIRVLR